MNESGKTEMDPPSGADPSEDPRLWQLVQEYEVEVKAGRRPSIDAYAARYPELAGAVRECLQGLELFQAALSGQPSSGTSKKQPSGLDADARPAAPLGDFQIVGEIARGGMGIVYEAIQLSLGRRVALKVLPFAATMDDRSLQRFKLEAQAAALLHHTHIVPIYAVGCERGVHFYAMQLIHGQSLAAVIASLKAEQNRDNKGRAALEGKAVGSLSDTDEWRRDSNIAERGPEQRQELQSTADVSQVVTAGNSITSEAYVRRAVGLMIQAAEALEHAHQAGVIHRDVKPANLLVDRTGNLWITDFGLAQLQDQHSMTRSSDMVGTFRYMSPEQTGGERAVLDHRTDIYSLSATFYELLTLEPAVAAPTHQELFYQILHVEPRRPHELNRAIPVELETILLKGLSKSASDRYSSAAELAADLQRFLDHKPILARRPSPVDRIRKWGRRNPSLVVAAVALLVVIAVGSLTANWMISAEQQKTATALEGQKLRAEEAEARFRQARQAVDTLFQISEEELAGRPEEAARRRILEVVLSHYEEFIAQKSGDPASQSELEQVQTKVKAILHELNVIQSALDRRLLELDAVQTELKLTDEQREQLNAFLTRTREQAFRLYDSLEAQSEATRRSQMAELAEGEQAELERILTSAQWTRFRQIALQARGIFAFKDPEIVRALRLTSDQRAAIRDIERQMFSERFRPPGIDASGRFPPPGPPGPPPPFARIEPSRGAGRPFGELGGPRTSMARWVAKAVELLTPEQVAVWRELTGPEFSDQDALAPPGPPGPPGPPRL